MGKGIILEGSQDRGQKAKIKIPNDRGPRKYDPYLMGGSKYDPYGR
jgi:hypothetical protein